MPRIKPSHVFRCLLKIADHQYFRRRRQCPTIHAALGYPLLLVPTMVNRHSLPISLYCVKTRIVVTIYLSQLRQTNLFEQVKYATNVNKM
jgi:hypothetical protein